MTNITGDDSAAGAAQAIVESAAELERLIARHRQLLQGMSGEPADTTCAGAECPCRRVLRDTLLESIAVLEETRKAFKSRQLGDLRRKLMQTLAEHV